MEIRIKYDSGPEHTMTVASRDDVRRIVRDGFVIETQGYYVTETTEPGRSSFIEAVHVAYYEHLDSVVVRPAVQSRHIPPSRIIAVTWVEEV